MDDEQAVQTLLTYPLRKEGYEVVGAMDGQEALDRFTEQRFDLVVLDIMLPKLDGIEVCRRLRTRSQVPIIMLTAKGDEIDKVAGLEMGADDYITKPFSVREFRSRVKAALRRGNMAGPVHTGDEPIRAGDLEIDFERRSTKLSGKPVQLTYVEFEILAALAGSPGRVFTRENLLEHIWGDSTYRDPAPSTSTSGTSARSSSPTRKHRSTSSRCAASATASATRIAIEAFSSQHPPQQAGRSDHRDHGRGDWVRLPLRRPAARVEPDRGEAPPPGEARR